jgi:hypothetical protein
VAAAAPAAKKRRTAAPKAYMPQAGTANYAFVITLYLVGSGCCRVIGVSVDADCNCTCRAQAHGALLL